MASAPAVSPSWRALAFAGWLLSALLAGAAAAAAPAPPTPPPGSADSGSAPPPRRTVAIPQVTVEGALPPDQPEVTAADPTSATTTIPAHPGEGATAADYAAASPGVTIREFGLNQQATLSVRGSNADQVAVLFDGLPLNAAAGGGVDLSTLPATFIERVSVSRGAVGSRYGSGALGGALLIETRRPVPGEERIFGELSYGSFATGEASAGASLGLGASTSLLVTGFARSSRGDFPYLYDDKPELAGNPLTHERRANNDLFRTGGLARLLVDGDTRFDLLLEADGGRRGLPGLIQDPTPHARQSDARALAVARVSTSAGTVPLELKAGGRYGRLALTWKPEAAPPQYEGMLFAELAAHPLLGPHILELSAELGGEALSSPFGEYGVPGERRTNRRARVAAAASDELHLGSVTLVPALRVDRIGERTGWAPRLGTGLDLSRAVAVRANAGRSFRAPSFGELYLDQGVLMPNPNLSPEHAAFVDLGLSGHGAGLSATATGFFTLYEDVILYELNPPMRARPFNVGRALVYGGELEATAERGPFSLAAGYTLAWSENRVGDERFFGKDLTYHPRHRLHARGGVGFGRFEAHAEIDAQSRQFTNATNTAFMEARARVSLGAAWRLLEDQGLWMQATLRNLFDAQGQDLYGYPLPGRSLLVSVRLDYDASHPRRNR